MVEFEQVGATVKGFASEDATVVVGTVIDPEMSNQVRVTVVATGLGRPTVRTQMPSARNQPEMRVVSNRQQQAAAPAARAPLGNAPDYSQLDRPTVQRQRAVGDGLRHDVDSEEMLDIPAFLRRQAD